jgi:hypothetical protein
MGNGGRGSIATWVRNGTWSASKTVAARSSVMPKIFVSLIATDLRLVNFLL